MGVSIVNQIPIDLKNAMLAKDKVKLAALRAIKSAFLLESTKDASKSEISDEVAQQIISKLHKQRMDAYKIYVDQNRKDLADDEIQQAEILEKYLPKQLSEAEIKTELESIIVDVGASTMADIGKVMGKAMASLKGKADGSLISKLVKELLS
ncbi:MAG: glutamyl-tRNA amidotransferase [Crocinitomicaceae bacterium]|nr:glutamyl-tRNA amidotransferase [Crocinitomicaceae bacterium]|tara:strand:- start:14751 stop:15206 length:456 start_codon:yes stop_codon:yes gene_type:complete